MHQHSWHTNYIAEMERLYAAIELPQKEAVLHDHQSQNELLVLAGAGSGKTHVLTLRIARLVAEGASPDKIICVTFTVAAAEEMRERLAKWLGEERAQQIIACTFHSLSWKIVGNTSPDRSQPEGWRTLGFSQKPRIVEEDEKDQKSSPSEKREKSRDGEEERGEEISLDQLTPLAMELFERSSETLAAWRRSFTYLLVDEFQDIDPLQYRFCRALLGESKNFFAVGDDDQAIYGFRGADPSCILRFLENHPAAQMVKLELNYRSHPEVLQLANQIFAKKDPLLRKILQAPENSRYHDQKEYPSPRVVRLDFENGWREFKGIVERLQNENSEGRAWGEMALLARTNRLCATMRKALRHFDIPDEVVVQTVHASKGLEYGVVFLVGLSQKLFPFEKAEIEEERRLFYVAVTRAKERLYLCHAHRRFWKGKKCSFSSSEFLRFHKENVLERFWRLLKISD